MSGGQDSSSATDKTCTLLGGPFQASVQAVLALTAILTLAYKRSLERELRRRPWVVCFFDCSKQAYASLLQHIVNIAFGVAFVAEGTASERAWYLLIFFHIGRVRRGHPLCRHDVLRLVRRAVPVDAAEIWRVRPAAVQGLIWGLLASGEKLITAFAVVLPLRRALDGVAATMEGPVAAHPRLELIICMLLGPMVLNAVFYWLVDSIIMRRKFDAQHESVGDAVMGGREEPFLEEPKSSRGTFV